MLHDEFGARRVITDTERQRLIDEDERWARRYPGGFDEHFLQQARLARPERPAPRAPDDEPWLTGFLYRLTAVGFLLLLALSVLWLICAAAISILIAYHVDKDWSTWQRVLLGIGIFVVLDIVAGVVWVVAKFVWKLVFWVLTGQRLSASGG